jgi:hypothetical protein
MVFHTNVIDYCHAMVLSILFLALREQLDRLFRSGA